MNKQDVQKALEELKKQPKRKFTQSYDLIINLKNLVVKSNPVDFFVTLNHSKGREVKIAAFVGAELEAQAKEHCDLVIREKDFEKYQNDKKAAKKLAESYDYFIAQATLMPKVAAAVGRVFGPKQKMPNPKLGCVVPPNANLEPLITKLRRTVRMRATKATNLQCMVGKEDQSEEELIDNILNVYNTSVKQLPNEDQNIKNTSIKLTMGKPVNI
ncbi:50S ribosomal protein L1 [Candidatus Woesearchaeota archaeon]|nr:50S ribosomal protein L1 [Candidatus Woesearchaeota archaeon]